MFPVSKCGQQLLHEIDCNSIEQHSVLVCLESDDIESRAVGYEVVTSGELRARIRNFHPDPVYPTLCLRYLLECISLDLDTEIDDLVHSEGEAFLELSVPLDRYWEQQDAAMEWHLVTGSTLLTLLPIPPKTFLWLLYGLAARIILFTGGASLIT